MTDIIYDVHRIASFVPSFAINWTLFLVVLNFVHALSSFDSFAHPETLNFESFFSLFDLWILINVIPLFVDVARERGTKWNKFSPWHCCVNTNQMRISFFFFGWNSMKNNEWNTENLARILRPFPFVVQKSHKYDMKMVFSDSEPLTEPRKGKVDWHKCDTKVHLQERANESRKTLNECFLLDLCSFSCTSFGFSFVFGTKNK